MSFRGVVRKIYDFQLIELMRFLVASLFQNDKIRVLDIFRQPLVIVRS